MTDDPASAVPQNPRVLRVLIADDESIARKRLARLLAELPGVTAAGECASAEETLARLRDGGVDVVLLDVQMPGLSGLDAVSLLPEPAPYVIFCTAHPDHAVKAFEAGAVDYVLKPVEAARLKKALDRARARLAAHPGPAGGAEVPSPARGADPSGDPPLSRLAISTRKGIVLLDPATVTHAVLENELVTLHHEGGELSTDLTLQEIESRLPKGRFERVHRRALLNMEKVTRLEPLETGGYVARTTTGKPVVISRQVARDLRKRLGLRKAEDDDAP